MIRDATGDKNGKTAMGNNRRTAISGPVQQIAWPLHLPRSLCFPCLDGWFWVLVTRLTTSACVACSAVDTKYQPAIYLVDCRLLR